MKKYITIITVATLLIIFIIVKLVINKSTIDAKNQLKAKLNSSVNVELVTQKLLSTNLSITGVTEAKQGVLLKSEASGQVVAINFNLGDYVSKGTILVELDQKLAQLALENAKLNLTKAEDDYNKLKNLYSGQATTETKLRDANIDFEKAKLNYEQTLKQFSFTKIIASQNGHIISKQVEKGAYVNAGTPILTIVDISQLKISLNASEGDVYKLKTGQIVKVTSSIYPGTEFNGRISFVSQQGDALHNYPVEILLENKNSKQLKAGSFVNVDFSFSSNEPSLVIPREALVGSIKNAKVYIVNNDKVLLKDIIVGRDFGDYLEVLSGLIENQKIVTTGQINLSNGSSVSIIN
ncbi:MAG: efflux RND transporter periplasmic adaptor subunit [Melioribacteraceae bacterium]|jgi:RND family efflux transporter MFP subunit